LGLHINNKLRRKALLEKIEERKFPENNKLDQVDLIREDRDR